MSDPAVPAVRRPPAARRPSLSGTLLRLAAVAAIAAMLVWSVLFVDLVHKRADIVAASRQPNARLSTPNAAGHTQSPAPVTTRTS